MEGHGCWDRKPAVSTPGSKNRSKSEGVGGCGEFRVGDERCFYWTSSGGHGLGNELSLRLVHPQPVASSTLTALPQGLGILQLRRISVGVFSVHWTLWDC